MNKKQIEKMLKEFNVEELTAIDQACTAHLQNVKGDSTALFMCLQEEAHIAAIRLGTRNSY